jgi:hypothetical protein
VAEGDEEEPKPFWSKFLEEAATPFEPAQSHAPSLETLRSLYSSVLLNYDFTCAMTGRRFQPPAELLHDELEISAIHPLAAGGGFHVSNFLCLDKEAAREFRSGHISIGRNWQLLVDLSRVAPELMERLNANGKLRLPEAEIGRPDPAAVAYHREHVFLGG